MRHDAETLLEAQTASFLEAFSTPAVDDADAFVADLIESTTCSAPTPVPTSCQGVEIWEVLECFRYNRAAVRRRHRGKLVNLARCVVASQRTSHPIRRIRLVGHTDARGTPAFNVGLGLRRARAVAMAIRREVGRLPGGSSVRLLITPESRGEREPIVGSPERSRRVEVYVPTPVLAGGTAAAPALPTCACGLGRVGNTLRRKLASTLDQTVRTTTPFAGPRGPTGLFGSNFDYHSAVHAHWARLQIARVTGDRTRQARALGRVTEARLDRERAFLTAPANATFELPYGRAWLVLLLSEVAQYPGRATRAAVSRRRTAEQELLTWLERNTSTASNNATIGQHDSWLFALLLLVISRPILPGANARIERLMRGTVARHRATWRARTSLALDFLNVPSIIDTLDLLTGRRPAITPRSVASSRIATVSAGHAVGEEMTRLWPVAILARRDPAMCRILRARIAEWARHPEHWAFGPRTPRPAWLARFRNNSHWTPQFLWMAISLRC